ncbi:unnamed protein product [Caenorhabditis auriculariae]|uniref:Uncharacterized protein n=1 Tax=Caenorhabditis auriculariae TaxID=2777116 RepID=A0A8S1GSW6_9PELO|nr:unnamed protein product [Caenorhabditis auriculariae]
MITASADSQEHEERTGNSSTAPWKNDGFWSSPRRGGGDRKSSIDPWALIADEILMNLFEENDDYSFKLYRRNRPQIFLPNICSLPQTKTRLPNVDGEK